MIGKVEQACVIDGQFIGTFVIPIPERLLNGEKPPVCPLCKKQIKGGTNSRFLGCNNKHFPNSLCHPRCIEDAGGYEAASYRLKTMYEEFKQLRSKMKSEFGSIGWYREEEPNHDT